MSLYSEIDGRRITAVEVGNKSNGFDDSIGVFFIVVDASIAFAVEDLLLFLTHTIPHTSVELLYMSVGILASSGLLYTEYRLTVPTLFASIPAMLFAGLSRGFGRSAYKANPDMMVDNLHRTCLQTIIGALVGGAWGVAFGLGNHGFAPDLERVPLLLLNAFASALAIILGNSMVIPTDNEVYRIWDISTLIVITGVIGSYSTLLLRRSYTNLFQIFCFLIAVMCAGIPASTRKDNTQHHSSNVEPDVYRLIEPRLELSGDDSETIILSEEAHDLQSSAPVTHSHNSAFRKYMLGIGMALLWLVFTALNFTERQWRRLPVFLDHDYVPQSSLEIVLSMYKEPIDEVQELISHLKSMPALSDARVTIYIKDSEANSTNIEYQTGADYAVTLPNIGREGETFLNHILNRWDSLARQTVFLQAGIHNPREIYTHISNYYSRSQTGFLNLGWSGAVCNCEDCGDKFFWNDNAHLFPRIYNRIYNSTDCDKVLLSYKGQFIVSAARIRGINKDIYHALWKAFIDERSWAHQPEVLQGRPDSMSAPDFGYTMERMWNLLFQCSASDIIWKCPSLLSKWRVGGDIGDCQCFDV
ncbi:hypothetical protein E8E13_005633 [Curvularia kusanoi]|uniref:Uncharacterized protein n=1 Tax=Curvularia kusanoi TaxID=90978 RepID=A0A9P4THW9_CURKU|nr:hypothetical protein E8E13_005633 [Curvularia kusanoi]